jgi:hypothetical protein
VSGEGTVGALIRAVRADPHGPAQKPAKCVLKEDITNVEIND